MVGSVENGQGSWGRQCSKQCSNAGKVSVDSCLGKQVEAVCVGRVQGSWERLWGVSVDSDQESQGRQTRVQRGLSPKKLVQTMKDSVVCGPGAPCRQCSGPCACSRLGTLTRHSESHGQQDGLLQALMFHSAGDILAVHLARGDQG